MTRRSLSPAVRELLVHCIECEGWLAADPVRVLVATVEAAERRGLVLVERREGAIAAATITAQGRADMRWFGAAESTQ